MKSYDFEMITGYTEFVRENADYNPLGLQTTCLSVNENGAMTGYTESVLKHHDRQEMVIPLGTPYTHTTTKDIEKIEGDGTTATITHDDNTTTIIP